MTEYKIVLYYEKPMPEFFQNSMEAMLKRGVEQGFISGYEFQKKELASDKDMKGSVKKEAYKISKQYEERLTEPSKTAIAQDKIIEKQHEESIKDERKPIQDDTAGHDKPTEKGIEKLRRKREADGLVSLDKALRSDKPDNRKKGR